MASSSPLKNKDGVVYAYAPPRIVLCGSTVWATGQKIVSKLRILGMKVIAAKLYSPLPKK